jgi:hypothetical protein
LEARIANGRKVRNANLLYAIAPAEKWQLGRRLPFHRMGTRSEKHPGTRNSDAEALHQLAECSEGAASRALAARFANAGENRASYLVTLLPPSDAVGRLHRERGGNKLTKP